MSSLIARLYLFQLFWECSGIVFNFAPTGKITVNSLQKPCYKITSSCQIWQNFGGKYGPVFIISKPDQFCLTSPGEPETRSWRQRTSGVLSWLLGVPWSLVSLLSSNGLLGDWLVGWVVHGLYLGPAVSLNLRLMLLLREG